MEKEEVSIKNADDSADSADLTTAEKLMLVFSRILNAVALLTPTFLYGWGEDGWRKTLLFTAIYVLAKTYFKVAMATSLFGSVSDAVEELFSEDEDVRRKAGNRFVRESMTPMITFDAFVILSFGLSRLVGCI